MISKLEFYRTMAMCRYMYNFTWLGRPYIQIPQDMIALQEIIWEVKPDYVIETGVAHGGGLVFIASILEAIGIGQVAGIDVDIRPHNRDEIENHPLAGRIHLFTGSSTDMMVYSKIFQAIGKNKKVLVVLDSNHSHKHVLDELNIYKDIVSVGSYMVCMDTIVEFLPPELNIGKDWGEGNNPWTAVKEFLKHNDNFEVDRSIEDKLWITCAPGGWLKRIG